MNSETNVVTVSDDCTAFSLMNLLVVTLDEMIRHALTSLKGCVQGDSVRIGVNVQLLCRNLRRRIVV